MSKKVVEQERFFMEIGRLRAALPKTFQEVAEDLRATQDSLNASVIECTQEEATRILLEAQREAERIIEEARNRSGHNRN